MIEKAEHTIDYRQCRGQREQCTRYGAAPYRSNACEDNGGREKNGRPFDAEGKFVLVMRIKRFHAAEECRQRGCHVADSVVVITSPVGGSTFQLPIAGGGITISATATAAAGASVVRVKFFVDNQFIGQAPSWSLRFSLPLIA